MNGITTLERRTKAGIAALATLLAAGGYAAACQDTGGGGTGGSGGGSHTSTGSNNTGTGGGAPVSMFTPQGCQFSVAPRMEYTEYTTSAAMTAATPNIRRVRLGLGGNVQGTAGRADPSTSIAMAWQTDDGTLASEVTWGSDPDPSKWNAADRTSGVTWLTPHGDVNSSGDERMHEVYVCGLTPATTYYYRVGGGAVTGGGGEVWSDVYSFTTTPAAGSTQVTFAVTGDSRGEQSNAWQILQRRIHALAPTMSLFSGDMINLAPDQGEWEEWLDRAWKDSDGKYLTLAQTLTLAAHGNHDNHTALFFGNLTLPQDVGKFPQYTELFYSMDVGPVHVVVMDDAFIVNPSGDSSYQGVFSSWLTADLDAANKNRAKVPWIITVNHHPQYSSSVHGQDADVLRGRQFFAPIFQMYHVDIAFAGHDHDYERSKPLQIGADVDNPAPTADGMGPVFVVCAGSGADGYPANTSTFTALSKDFSGGVLGLYGILTADAHNLKLEAHELHSDATDPIFDTYTITK